MACGARGAVEQQKAQGKRKSNDDAAGRFNSGDRVGSPLDLNEGSLCFFQNGVEHGHPVAVRARGSNTGVGPAR